MKVMLVCQRRLCECHELMDITKKATAGKTRSLQVSTEFSKPIDHTIC